jgi:ribokinase
MRVEPLDTVGAGDTFAGTLAVHLAEGDPLERAIQFANCAAALATLKLGAQGSTPTRRATDRATARLFPNVNSSILTRS